MSSWNNKKVSVGGLHFQVNEEVIAKVTGLSMEGRKYKKTYQMIDTTSLNLFFRVGKNLVKKFGGFNREQLPEF